MRERKSEKRREEERERERERMREKQITASSGRDDTEAILKGVFENNFLMVD